MSINAEGQKIWALLTKGADYPRWNSTVISIDGTIALGEQIQLKSTLDPKRTLKLKVKEFEANKRLVWGDAMGNRTYRNILELLLPSTSSTGRPREHALHDIVNAILYVLYEGCRWRSLPKEYPKWQTVYSWFRRWRNDGTLEKIRRYLVAETRQKMGRNAEPSAGIIDTQTVKTASYVHRDAGYDSAKRIKGRKRSIVTNTQGLLLAVVVMSVRSSENQCGFMVLRRLYECYAGIRLVWCDAGFKATLILFAFSLWQIVLEVVP